VAVLALAAGVSQGLAGVEDPAALDRPPEPCPR
jgi:hypothetical protein